MISTIYPLVTFDQFLKKINRTAIVKDLEEYSCLGTRLGGQGAFIREIREGFSIERKKQSLVHAGDVIYNKLFAWRGAFAIADETVHGSIGSDKFPLYRLDTSLVEPDYLRYWFQSRHLHIEARRHSKGAAALSKLTLNPPEFWRLTMPVPSLSEQRRIVQRLATMFRTYNEIVELRTPVDAVVQGRRAGIGSEARLVLTSKLNELNQAYKDRLTILDSILTLRPRSGPSFSCSADGSGVGVVMPSALGGYRFDQNKVMFGNGVEQIKQSDLLSSGDILISRGNKRDQVGLCIVYPGSSESRTYANLLMKMQVRNDISPEFVKYWLMSPLSVRYIHMHTKGTSPSVQKVNQRALINLPFPESVPMKEQLDWVYSLNAIFNTVEEIEYLIREQHDRLKQFPDAILTSAFKGDL